MLPNGGGIYVFMYVQQTKSGMLLQSQLFRGMVMKRIHLLSKVMYIVVRVMVFYGTQLF